VAPASAAVISVNFSWTGTLGNVATGTISGINYTTPQSYTSGTLTAFSINAAPVSLTGNFVAFSFDINGSTAVMTPSSNFFLVTDGGDAGLSGDDGLPNWDLQNTGSFLAGSGANTLTLTVVPEPETYAAVAGAGLVAFGLFRRRAAQA
jgi:hypothetical protein